jgi:ketosteroid isomerase-like protein
MTASVEIVRDVYERFRQGDVQGVLASFGDDCEVDFAGPERIPFAGKYTGARGMGEAIRKFTDTCDIIEFSPDEFHADGEFVTVVGHEHCRCKATGRAWQTPLIETFLVRNGKIRKFRCLYDTARVADAYAPDAAMAPP